METPFPPTFLDNICPLYSGAPGEDISDTTAAIIWVRCLEDNCKFWDEENSQCEFILLGTKLNTILNRLDAVNSLQTHIHTSHYHVREHETGDISDTKGLPNKKSSTVAVPLIVEDSAGEDMDGNGYIYGRDFMIDPDDVNIPKMIKTLENQKFTGDLISWNDYLDSTSIYSIKVNGE